MNGPVAVHSVLEGAPGAPAIVFSHSLGASLATWEPQATALADGFKVIRYDLRGHGRSPVVPGPCSIADLGADLVALLDQLRLERAHLCGISLGAMASLWVAAHHPSRVAGLAVCCTAARLGPPSMWDERAALVRSRGTIAIADLLLERWFTPGFRARQPARMSELRALIAATPAEGYAGCCAALARMDLRDDLAAIRAPTLAIAAAGDPSTPPARLREITDAVPGARLEIVDDAAHLANLEQPEIVTRHLRRHFQEDHP